MWSYFLPLEPVWISQNWLCPGSWPVADAQSWFSFSSLISWVATFSLLIFFSWGSLPHCCPFCCHTAHPSPLRLALGQGACPLQPPSRSHWVPALAEVFKGRINKQGDLFRGRLPIAGQPLQMSEVIPPLLREGAHFHYLLPHQL